MEGKVVKIVEIALIHMLYAHAELQTAYEGAEPRAREHINEAIGLLNTLARHPADLRRMYSLVECIEIAFIQTLCAQADMAIATADARAKLGALQHISEAVKLMEMLAPQRHQWEDALASHVTSRGLRGHGRRCVR